MNLVSPTFCLTTPHIAHSTQTPTPLQTHMHAYAQALSCLKLMNQTERLMHTNVFEYAWHST